MGETFLIIFLGYILPIIIAGLLSIHHYKKIIGYFDLTELFITLLTLIIPIINILRIIYLIVCLCEYHEEQGFVLWGKKNNKVKSNWWDDFL